MSENSITFSGVPKEKESAASPEKVSEADKIDSIQQTYKISS